MRETCAGIEQREKSNLLALPDKLLGHLKSHQSAHRITSNKVGAVRLNFKNGLKVPRCHFFYAGMRRLLQIHAKGLNTIDGTISIEIARKRSITKDSTVLGMNAKQRWLGTAGAQSHQSWMARRRIQRLNQSRLFRYGGILVEHWKRKLLAEGPLNLAR